MNDDQISRDEATEALAAINATRRGVAGRVGSPPHYYTQLAVSFAAIVIAQPLPPLAGAPLLLLGVGILGWAVRSYSAHTGTWSMATLREPGAWMAWLMIAIMITALGVAIFTDSLVASIAGAVIVLLTVPVLGPRWDAAWVRSLERDA